MNPHCTGKVVIPTASLAKKIAKRSMASRKGRVSYYRCPVCHGWHIGTRVGKKPYDKLKHSGVKHENERP